MPGVKPRYGGGSAGAAAWAARWAERSRASTAPRRGIMAQYKTRKRNGPGAELRARCNCDPRRSDLADVLRLQALRTLGDLEFDRIALGETAEALSLDRREVDEHIGTRLLRDKAKALRVVEPLHLTLCHTVQTSALRGTAPDMCDPGHRDQRRAQTKTARQVVLAERRQTGDGATYCLNRGQT